MDYLHSLKLDDLPEQSEDEDEYEKRMAGAMRVSILHDDSRFIVDVDPFMRVKDVKELVREHFHIGPDEGPAGAEIQEKKILTLVYAGADLNDNHWFADLGITPGSTIKAILREEIKPSLFLYTAFNGKIIPVLDKVPFKTLPVSEFRGLASRKVGLPVGAFRLVNSEGKELFDGDDRTIEDYGIELSCTVEVHTWDGWNELLNLGILGFSTQALQHLAQNEQTQRYQLKVMLYMAAHFNHIDLAVSILRNGIRADEAVGEHPSRQWCREKIQHIDSMKAPVHEAAEAGSLGVLRSFVHNNVMNVLAKDGNSLTPLNIALRRKQKPCASFLLTKQWSKINYTKRHAIPLSIYVKIKRWADRSKDKAFVLHGAWKSSLKNPKRFLQTGALVGLDVQVDGFSSTKMSSKSEAETRYDAEQEELRKQKVWDFSDDIRADLDPEQYFKSISQITSVRLPRITKFGKIMAKQASLAEEKEKVHKDAHDGESMSEEGPEGIPEVEEDTSGHMSPDAKRKHRARTESQCDDKMDQRSVRFPPIQHHQRVVKSQSVYNMHTTATRDDSEAQPGKAMYLKTGPKTMSVKTARTLPTPTPSRRLPSEYAASRKSKDEEVDTARKDSNRESQEQQAQRKRKRERLSHSEAMLAKARNESHNIPLPVQSWDTNPRPFVNPRSKEIHETLKIYEKKRGMTSRDYAIQCLSVANSFKEKPWLAQVHQAMTIAQKGVKKTVNKCPHMFQITQRPPSTAKSLAFGDLDSETVTTRTFMTA